MRERSLVITLALAWCISFCMAAYRQDCDTASCTGNCTSSPCKQTCNVTDCRMKFSCAPKTQNCELVCTQGGCPEMLCNSSSKIGECLVTCHKDCKNMKAIAGKSSRMFCYHGGCDMECSNYGSTCHGQCPAGNCNLICRTQYCELACAGGNCTITGGLETNIVRLTGSGSNSKVTCAMDKKCEKAGCDANNNCVVYVKNPLNETAKPAQPVAAAQSLHASVWMLVATAIGAAAFY